MARPKSNSKTAPTAPTAPKPEPPVKAAQPSKKFTQSTIMRPVKSPNTKIQPGVTKLKLKSNYEGTVTIYVIRGDEGSEGFAVTVHNKAGITGGHYSSRFMAELVHKGHAFGEGFVFQIRDGGGAKDFHLYLNDQRVNDERTGYGQRIFVYWGPVGTFTKDGFYELAEKIVADILSYAQSLEPNIRLPMSIDKDTFLVDNCVWADCVGTRMAVELARAMHEVVPAWGVLNPDAVYTFIRKQRFTAYAARILHVNVDDVLPSERAALHLGKDVIDVDNQSDNSVSAKDTRNDDEHHSHTEDNSSQNLPNDVSP